MGIPSLVFLTKGSGKDRNKLSSFEMALRDAKIAALNIVRVSSIFPPHAKLISLKEGQQYIRPGMITHVVLSENSTNEPHRLIAASVGLAIPQNPNHYGYLSEHHSFGEIEKKAGDYAEDMAAEMLASTLGVPFDPDKSWDEKKEVFKISKDIVNTRNITQTAVGDKNGLWTTVVAGAVLIEKPCPLDIDPNDPLFHRFAARTYKAKC